MNNTDTPQIIEERNEAYFEQFGNDQLAFFAWRLHDDYLECLFDEENLRDNIHEAACSFAEASIALRVLTRRLIGVEPSYAKSKVDHMHMVSYGLAKPDGETLQ
ncbi:hypothetical protein [Pseudomonas asplenii]|uniref:Uncharacterized protein n=1 Tax=Pseudomonas asplenii TaxID=53407 RepID=A0A1H6P2F3_9PSED|nr:hypothetical protein [Pseudomonas fuscovaginae]SEI23635.1 hypothetical protein SAMN05216581_5247 [Pseudomonas fuscovaginae]